MIVNTQVFNYRFTIGTLIIAIIALAIYGFSNYSELEADRDYLVHEKKLLQKELNRFIDSYDEISSTNTILKSQFENAKLSAQNAYDSLGILKANVSTLARYKAKLMLLEKQNEILQSNSNKDVIDDLEKENGDIAEALSKQKALNEMLEKENRSLAETVEKGTLLFANSFEAKVFRTKKSGEKVQTNKFNNAETFEVCFVLGENPLAAKGEKKFYIQIVGPDNNVVNDKGAVNFGESSLIYSSSIAIEYNNVSEEICANIPNNESFNKGVYYVSVFENERKLGSTQIELN